MKHAPIAFSAVFALLLAGGVWTHATAAPASLPGVTVNAYELERQDITLQTTIVQVDRAKGTVTLTGPEGQEETVEVSSNAGDLGSLKPGDKVITHYLRAVALQVLPAHGGKPGVEYSGSMGPADNAAGPVYQTHHTETVTTVLAAVDIGHNTVTLVGVDGHKRIIDIHQLKQREKLDNLKAGDLVRVTFVEAAAISLEPKSGSEQTG